MSPGAHALAAIGTDTEQVVLQYQEKDADLTLFSKAGDENLKRLAKALSDVKWMDKEAAKIVARYFADLRDGNGQVEISALCRWVEKHVNNCDDVFECMSVLPPDLITITQVLPRVGSQKVVFLANWTLAQRAVVLKRFSGSPELREQVAARESQAHPLSMAHRNIIETYIMRNAEGEVFLVEEYLPVFLSDKWQCPGVQEAANLLYDIASALHYMHSDLKYVHGDVKPDNVGKRGPDYLLMDFGICRPIDQFVFKASATGSLRTRAPELLLTGSYACPTKIDVWALGATLYNAVTGRYPLFEKDETPPKITQQQERETFQAELRRRAQYEWDRRVDLQLVPEPLRSILQGMLEKDPEERSAMRDVLSAARDELAGFLRNQIGTGHLSPMDELGQLLRLLPSREVLVLMPATEKEVLRQRLKRLSVMHGVPDADQSRAEEIVSWIK
jgi:serine/threonine protein kinase